KREPSLWDSFRASKDPTTFTVLAEDAAALVGLLVAALGVWLSDTFDSPAFDGAASIAIGLLLAGVAVLLIRESRSLLVGEGIRPSTAAAICELAGKHPRVRSVTRPLSMYLGPDEVLVVFDVEFEPDAGAEDIASAVRRIEADIRARFPGAGCRRLPLLDHAVGTRDDGGRERDAQEARSLRVHDHLETRRLLDR